MSTNSTATSARSVLVRTTLNRLNGVCVSSCKSLTSPSTHNADIAQIGGHRCARQLADWNLRSVRGQRQHQHFEPARFDMSLQKHLCTNNPSLSVRFIRKKNVYYLFPCESRELDFPPARRICVELPHAVGRRRATFTFIVKVMIPRLWKVVQVV
jgi:hypothetical protein